MPEIAREQGITTERVRTIKKKGLRRLRIGKARRILLEKFDIVDSVLYRNNFNKFNEHGSTVEYAAIRLTEIKAEYERVSIEEAAKAGKF